jgi:hypothetical protein
MNFRGQFHLTKPLDPRDIACQRRAGKKQEQQQQGKK